MVLGVDSKRNQQRKKNDQPTYKEQLEPLQHKRIVFIFDDCHRSQFGENLKAIKEFFPKASSSASTARPSSRKMRARRRLRTNRLRPFPDPPGGEAGRMANGIRPLAKRRVGARVDVPTFNAPPCTLHTTSASRVHRAQVGGSLQACAAIEKNSGRIGEQGHKEALTLHGAGCANDEDSR